MGVWNVKVLSVETSKFCVPLLSALLTGCVPIPTPYGTSRISEKTIAAVVPGTTTRADVLLALGTPDESDSDDRRFAWYWTETYSWNVWSIGIGTGGMFPTYGGECLDIAFDERGIVTRAEKLGQGLYGGPGNCLKSWPTADAH